MTEKKGNSTHFIFRVRYVSGRSTEFDNRTERVVGPAAKITQLSSERLVLEGEDMQCRRVAEPDCEVPDVSTTSVDVGSDVHYNDLASANHIEVSLMRTSAAMMPRVNPGPGGGRKVSHRAREGGIRGRAYIGGLEYQTWKWSLEGLKLHNSTELEQLPEIIPLCRWMVILVVDTQGDCARISPF
jgi:hypothetical protein